MSVYRYRHIKALSVMERSMTNKYRVLGIMLKRQRQKAVSDKSQYPGKDS